MSLQNGFRLLLAGEDCELLPEHAIWWAAEHTLFVADLHLGKSATFGLAGLPVPDPTNSDLARLSGLLVATQATRLVILGDLMHTRRGRDVQHVEQAMTDWRRSHARLQVDLVLGNHDRYSGQPAESWRIDLLEEGTHVGPFVLRHHPQPSPDGYVLAGHLHPAVRLNGGGERLKLPCFWMQESLAVLPAFSAFIDGMVIRELGDTDRIFAVADNSVIPIHGQKKS